MSLIALGPCGQGSNDGTATVFVATLTVNLPVGTVVVARFAGHTEAAATGATTRHSLLDSKLNTWTKVAEATNSAGGWPNNGPALSLWLSVLTVPLVIGDTVTLTSTVDSFGSILALTAFDKGGESQGVILVSAASATGEAQTFDVTLAPPASGEYVWLGAGTYASDNLTVVLDSDYETDLPKLSVNGTPLWGQYRSFEGSTDTLNASVAPSSRKFVMILAALEVVELIRAVPQEGVHDTFYGRPILLDEPNWVTPVRQTMDPALGVSGGPAGVWEATRRAGNLPPGMALQAQFTLFGRETIGRWRAFLDRVSGRYKAFWCPGWTAAARMTADAAADQPALAVEADHPFTDGDWIAVLKHNRTLIATQVATVEDAGASLVLASDLPVAVPQTPSRVSRLYLVRLATDDVGLTFHSADIAELTLTVVAVHPDELTAFDSEASFGEDDWQFSERPEVSAPSLLKRPNFGQDQFSLTWSRGSPWVDPSITTDNYTLYVRTQEAVDAIELQCADEFPVGFQPDEYEPGSGIPFIWDKQNQEFTNPGGIGPGSGTGFTISITHGLQTMTPCAFRARTRKAIDGAICYSPWRYWLALEMVAGGTSTSSAHADTTTCGRYHVICANGPGDWVHGPVPPGNPDPFSCTLGVPAPPAGGWNCQIIESTWSQQSTFPFQWHARYNFMYRTTLLLDFSDRHATILQTGRSQVGASFGSGGFFPADTSFINSDQYPLQLPETPE